MAFKNLWICVLEKRESDTGPTVKHCGKIIDRFGTVAIYDSVDWDFYYKTSKFTTSGAIYRLDISDMTKQVVMFHCIEDALEEVETRERRFHKEITIE
jgi:hypothetical protein